MQESEEELNERLRQLKGLDKERDKNKKMSKQEQEEENLFKKNKGAPPPPSMSSIQKHMSLCSCDGCRTVVSVTETKTS